MEYKKLIRIKDNLTKFSILFILIIIGINYTHNQHESIDNLTNQIKQLEVKIKDLNADVNICTNEVEEVRQSVNINSEHNLDIRDTIDYQATQINTRIDDLNTQFEEVSAQRLFITEDE